LGDHPDDSDGIDYPHVLGCADSADTVGDVGAIDLLCSGHNAEDGNEDDEDDDAYEDSRVYNGSFGLTTAAHHHHLSADGTLGNTEVADVPEMHSELMEAVMQQWLQTPAGQSAAHEAARLELSTDEVGQFFHARMLQSLGRLRLGGAQDPSIDQMRVAVGTLPEEEEAAVLRLAALGFVREQAAEAYLACDRNEMLAANFLMDSQ